jgi:uncharacterized damage-inducible protein DinB
VGTPDDLLDVHRRTHSCLARLLDHCAGFSAEELRRDLAGFGYPNLLLQLHHVLGAERYWIGVLRGQMLVDEPEEEKASIDALRALRERVADATRDYLHGASDAELRARREVATFRGRRIAVVPLHVLLRTQTHVFHHQGQVVAMCRLLGRPVPPGLLDYPLGE